MRDNYFLKGDTAAELYNGIKDLPILDYHCHLSPKEILEDKVFENIGVLWLGGDHYKWRLMRQAGVPEEYITGNAPWREKFRKYAETVSMAGGNPLYSWSMMELSMYFDIDTPLNGDTADEIFDEAQKYIEENQLSPRKLITKANVDYIATTDDPADPLDYHREIRKDGSFKTVVVPAFRTDNLLNIQAPDFADYISRFGSRVGVIINSISDLRIAFRLALDEFSQLGCSFSDVGIERFPSRVYSREEAAPVFRRRLSGEELSEKDIDIYLGYMFNFLSGEYCKRGMTMQLHLSAMRNISSDLYRSVGRDAGGDCIGDAPDGTRIASFLDTVAQKNKLPKTIIYTLNPQLNAQLSAICGTFRNVVPGAAWWFCDHRRGIMNMMETMAEEGYFGSFMGMLTDSRSFLSYARHDYFRRLLCTLLARWVDEDDFPMSSAKKLAQKISYGNVFDTVKPQIDEMNFVIHQ